jgi:hypothetical protein
MQVGAGDNRTGLGIHEGISCLACHQQHGQKTRASCATCHPRLSNCGLDVEKMDTTFRSAESKHNIHWAKCGDCHVKGVPKKRQPTGRQLVAASKARIRPATSSAWLQAIQCPAPGTIS